MSTHASLSRSAATLLALVIAASPSAGAPVSPLDTGLFSFPGAVDHPFSAYSASVALADRWLPSDPCGNAAVDRASVARISPAFIRASRQDLRADNRNYDETPMFLDGGGVSVVLEAPLELAISAYALQPVLRLEDNAFTRGRGNIDPGNPPALIQSETSSRELLTGVGLSKAAGPIRVGAAVEWTQRKDFYEVVEQSGSPDAGTRRLEFLAKATGFQLGAQWAPSPRFALAGSARRLPRLDLDCEQRLDLFSGDSAATFVARREAAWEGGLSTRVVAAEGLSLLASLGGRGEQSWEGLGVVAGAYYQGAVGLDYHVPDSDWSLRFGLGHEQQTDVPEPRAMRIAIGAGWDLEGMILDVGVVRRTFDREGSPMSYDDRILITARVDF